MTMERWVAKNNAYNDEHALLLPLPSPSLAHMVAVVLSVRTLFDIPLPSPPSSSCHCLPTAFLIDDCPHHQSIASSCCQPLLAFTTLPLMVGCCVHAHFVVLSPFCRLCEHRCFCCWPRTSAGDATNKPGMRSTPLVWAPLLLLRR